MAAATKFNVFTEDLAEGAHNLDAHDVYLLLTNTAPVVTNAVKADLTEISAGNGYTAGGKDITNGTSRSGGTTTVSATDQTWTAAGGTIGPFRYVAAYNNTQTTPAKPLIQFYDYGSSITLADGETFTVDFGVNGLMQIS